MTSSTTTDYFTQLLTETDASKKLAVSVGALRRWRREGRGPAFARLEKCVRYDVRDLEKFLAEHTSAKSESAANDKPNGGESQSSQRESMSDLKWVRK